MIRGDFTCSPQSVRDDLAHQGGQSCRPEIPQGQPYTLTVGTPRKMRHIGADFEFEMRQRMAHNTRLAKPFTAKGRLRQCLFSGWESLALVRQWRVHHDAEQAWIRAP